MKGKLGKNTGTIIAVNKRCRRYSVKLDSGEFRKRNRRYLLLLRGKEFGFKERERDPVKDKDQDREKDG